MSKICNAFFILMVFLVSICVAGSTIYFSPDGEQITKEKYEAINQKVPFLDTTESTITYFTTNDGTIWHRVKTASGDYLFKKASPKKQKIDLVNTSKTIPLNSSTRKKIVDSEVVTDIKLQKNVVIKKVKATPIVDIIKRHTAGHPIKVQRITSMVDKSSTIDNILIKGKAGVQFYTTDVYEKYNLFKFVVLYFWYYIDKDSVIIKYETNKGDYKKILVHRRDVEKLTGDLNQVTRKQVGDIRYNKRLAKIMFLYYLSIK